MATRSILTFVLALAAVQNLPAQIPSPSPAPAMPMGQGVYRADSFQLVSGQVLAPVEVSYRTFGTLAPAKDNVVFICPEFRSTSHLVSVAGGDTDAGYLDLLLGPGKLFDTDKIFAVTSDGLGCPVLGLPDVQATGPHSIDPKSGKPYGNRFPIYAIADMVNLHVKVLQSLGITRLKLLYGQSLGGWQVMEWAVAYPEMVEKGVLVAADGHIQPLTMNAPFGDGISRILDDPAWNGGNYYSGPLPVKGVADAQWELISWTTSYFAMGVSFREKNPDLMQRLLQGLDPTGEQERSFQIVSEQGPDKPHIDANGWIYRARAAILADPGRDRGGYAAALDRVQAAMLFISSESDMLAPSRFAQETVDLLQAKGKSAAIFIYPGTTGHAGSCKNPEDQEMFSPRLREFIGDSW